MGFQRRGFVVLALPKCASTALEAALGPHADFVIDSPPSRKHLGVKGFTKRIEPELAAQGYPRSSYELVSMFREPISWLESWWRYRLRDDAREGNSTSEMPFEEFARLFVAEDPTAPTPRGRPAAFVTHEGLVGVDRIFAVERPEVWGAWIGSRLGAAIEVPARNVSERAPAELSASTRAALVDYLAPEYAVWARLQKSGMWADAAGTPLPVAQRPRRTR